VIRRPDCFLALGAPIQATSTGTANVATITLPGNAIGFVISIETNAARVTFDGSTPGATSTLFPVTSVPYQFTFQPAAGQSIKFASNIAANSVVTVQPLQ
jgi:hypothetical protein